MELLAEGYLWFKAIHIVAVISWMVGLLYLPRLFVYHCATEDGSAQSETFKVMERRLHNAIMTPAMLVAWVFGILLILTPGVIDWQMQFWIYVKLFLVILLSGFHGFLGGQVKLFAKDENMRSAGFFRMINEVPTLVMIFIVILAVVKPF